MFIIYDLVFMVFGLLYLPLLLFKGKAHKGFLQRFGFFTPGLEEKLKAKNNLWVHAVSVGEVQAVSPLLDYLRKIFPLERIIISTVTPAGNQLAHSLLKKDELAFYFPLDFSFVVNKFVKIIKPRIFITTETEIWPNLILSLRKNNVPVVLVNGRISQASFKGYKIARVFIRSILQSIKLFCMQTPLDAERIRVLGAAGKSVAVTGNMKFDALSSNIRYKLSDLSLRENDLLLIAGSTHYGEEEIIIRVYKNLLAEFNNLKLLIAPRHIERCGYVESLLDKEGLRYIRFSAVQAKYETSDAIVLDTIGSLSSLYALADVVFIGGSLIKKGGHNVIEPAIFGKAIIFGPFMFNFRDISQMFLERGAAIRIDNKEELEKTIRKLLLDKDLREKIGREAKSIVEENKGATAKTANLISDLVNKYA